MAECFRLRSRQPPGAGTVGGISGGHGTGWADRDLIVVRRCVRADPGNQVDVRDGQETREALTEDLRSRYRVHRDVDVDVVDEVAGEDLGRGYPGSSRRRCVCAEIRVEVGRKRGCDDQEFPSRSYSVDSTGLGRATPAAKPCFGRTSDRAAPGAGGWAALGRTTPVAKPKPSFWCPASVGRTIPVAKPCIGCTSHIAY